MKQCIKCKIEKDEAEFSKDKKAKFGLRSWCKPCTSEYHKQYRQTHEEKLIQKQKQYYKKHKEKMTHQNKQYHQKHKEESKEYQKKYRQEHKSELSQQQKQYYQEHKEKMSQQHEQYYQEHKEETAKYQKQYYQERKEKISQYQKQYRQEHKSELAKQKNKYTKNRKTVDINFYLACNLRTRLSHILLSKTKRKAGSAVRDLGCTVEELKVHLESKFTYGMNWENRGKWHIDHIKPLASFDLSNREQFLEACNWKNLQPLWALDNIKKRDKVI